MNCRENLILVETKRKQNQTIHFFQSTIELDPVWDNFLARSRASHFEQSCAWAIMKKRAGWFFWRIIIELDGKIIGGFQILWKKKFTFLKIGLLLKGPIIETNDPIIINVIIDFLKKYTKGKLSVLIIQPPEKNLELYHKLTEKGLVNNEISFIIKSATVTVDLSSIDDLWRKIKRQKKQNIRRAEEAGIIIRQGDHRELPIFFDLMKKTCQRRKVLPNPPSLHLIECLWGCLAPQGQIKLFLAQGQNEIISGILVILLGETAYLWKFGWSGRYANYYPNELLFWEIFKWSKQQGFDRADLGYITSYRRIGRNLSDTYNSWPDKSDAVFKMGLGGQITKLPPAAVYIPNFIFRLAYKLLVPWIDARPKIRDRFISVIE
ncbi:MAG: peptidoglycan bridge formation glycyltransferase FemA/FemB family protein [Candidatus Aminicenantes bacterium]|nr:peptidoglycan bridge formation glycyltransferase FemA/FemB family protein [Candidatus Aminicenantes bacterium]